MLEAGLPYKCVNGVDKNAAVHLALFRLHGEQAELHQVDIDTIPLKTLTSSDGFIGTAPC